MIDKTYRVRCRKCRARRNLSKHPDHYVRPPRCWGCRRTGTLSIDTYRQYGREKRKQNTCWCDGLMHPHRHGSLGCNDYDPPIPWETKGLQVFGDEVPF